MTKADSCLTAILRLTGIFALASCGLFFWQLRNTASEMQTVVRDADSAVKEAQRRVADTSQNLNAALIQVGLATDEARRASVEQRQYWNRISRETIGLIGDARTTITKAGADIDGVAGDFHAVTGDLHGVSQTTVESLKALPPLLEQSNRTLAAANTLISDPEITRSIQGLAEASQNVAATTANVEKISEDVQKKVHQMTQPKSLWKLALGWLLDTAYKVKALV